MPTDPNVLAPPTARIRPTRVAGCLALCGALAAMGAIESRADEARNAPVKFTRQSAPLRFPLSFGAQPNGAPSAMGLSPEPLKITAQGIRLAGPNPPRSMQLLDRYRQALERESRRALDKDPSLFWTAAMDEEGYPERRSQRRAVQIFEGANGRLLTRLLEDALAETEALRATKSYIEGIRLDVRKGGGVKLAAEGLTRDAATKASFGLLLTSNPRLEVTSTLPGGFKGRLEVPLRQSGVRATISRPIAFGMRGTLSAGQEDSSESRWVSLGLEIKF